MLFGIKRVYKIAKNGFGGLLSVYFDEETFFAEMLNSGKGFRFKHLVTLRHSLGGIVLALTDLATTAAALLERIGTIKKIWRSTA
ncbi:MAG: hypothetical protein WDN67_01615 [Candidatus Moraniibacteriota bacterium]